MAAIKTSSYPTNLLYVDTETMSTAHPNDSNTKREVFWFGYALCYRREHGERTREHKVWLNTIEDFWRLVDARLDPNRPLWIFAHNLMFDMTILDIWTQGDKHGIEVVLPVLDDPPTFICCTHAKGKLNFVDTFNYWKASVADIGVSMGLPKLKMPKRRVMSTRWRTYCARDVDVLAKAVDGLIEWLQSNDLGSLSFTIASIAMGTFKHRFMPTNSIHVHDNQPLLDMERESYHGGLTHCYYIGEIKQKIYKLDVNSLYPTMMLRDYPVRPHKRHKRISVVDLIGEMKRYGAVARVRLNSPTRPYPVYDGKRLLEAVGQYETTLCGDELQHALIKDDVTQVVEAQTYQMRPIFKAYVEYFYKKRLEYKAKNDSIGDGLCKLMLNSLYGKFAQRSFEWIDLTYDQLDGLYRSHGLEIPSIYEDQFNLPVFALGVSKWTPLGYPEPLTLRYVGGCLQARIFKGEHHESCPIIASYVTSYARAYLRSLTQSAGRRTVYYSDTDSLFVSEGGYRRLKRDGHIDPKLLGKLKLEDTATRLTIYGPKDYEFGAKRVAKGIRRNAVPVCKQCGRPWRYGKIKCHCGHTSACNDTFRQVQFEGIKGILRRENAPYVDVSTVIKTLHREYRKGTIRLDGWTDYPVLSLD